MALDVSLLVAVLEGAGAAAVSAGYGYAQAYLKARSEGKKEEFDPVKAGDTVAIGAILGAIAGFYGISVLDAQNLLVSLGVFSAIVYLVDAGVKALVRYIYTKLKKPIPPEAE